DYASYIYKTDEITITGDFIIGKDNDLIRYIGTDANVDIPNTIEKIGNFAFFHNLDLVDVKIPEGVTSIGDLAFSAFTSLITMSSSAMEQSPTSSLESVEFSSTLTEIGYSAFSFCSSLQYIDIPASVETIEGNAFSGISRLTIRLNVEPSKISVASDCIDAVEFNLIVPDNYVEDYKDDDYWKDIQDLRVISISDFLENNGFIIDGENVLVGYVGNDSTVVIPDGVTSIGEYAFADNMNLREITIPAAVLSIGDYAFSGCENLKLVNFEAESMLSSIGAYAFQRTSKLETIDIPSTVTVLSEGLFSFSGIAYITIHSTVVEIGDDAFYDNYNLRGVVFERNELNATAITKIGEGAFFGCSTLMSFYVPGSVRIIDDGAFALSGLAIIMFEANSALEEIGVETFYQCYELTTISIPASVKSIGIGAFAYAGINSIMFEDGSALGQIGGEAFYACYALTTITIPASVTSIGDDAFAFSGLTSILFEENSIIKVIGAGSIASCGELISIVLPDSVKQIKENAFWNSSNLISVTIGPNITNIEAKAFEGVSRRIVVNIDIYEVDANFAVGWDIIGSEQYGDEDPTIIRITQINWKEAPSNPSEPSEGGSSLTGGPVD
ncbi:MAG: leucine-rich repeat domain-containing protein, partial [Christensenellaceae bacterium]|nr:leucine-rich repeat domain-containing protein [Christensenellaceae bacterium]